MSSHSPPGCVETAVQRSESKQGPRLSCHRLLATAGGWDGTCRPLLRVLPAIPSAVATSDAAQYAAGTRRQPLLPHMERPQGRVRIRGEGDGAGTRQAP